MKGKIIFLIIWSLAMGIVLDRIFNPREERVRKGTPIGEVIKAKGTVQLRGEEEVLWTDAESNHPLFENDSISTGRDSSVKIYLGDRGLQLGPNTQIKLRTESSNSNDFEVSLVKGMVATAKATAPSLPNVGRAGKKGKKLVISTGREVFEVRGKKDVLGIVKETPGQQARVLASAGKVTVRQKNRTSPTRLRKTGDHNIASLMSDPDKIKDLNKGTPALTGRDRRQADTGLIDEEKDVIDLNARPPELETVELSQPAFLLDEAINKRKIQRQQAEEQKKERQRKRREAWEEEKRKFRLGNEAETNRRKKAAAKHIPKIVFPNTGVEAWIASLPNRPGVMILPVKLRPSGGKGAGLQPVIGAESGKLSALQGTAYSWKGKAGPGLRTIPVDVFDLQSKGLVSRKVSSRGTTYTLQLKPGVVVRSGAREAMIYGPPKKIILRSWENLSRGPVRIRVRGIRPFPQKSGIIWQKSNFQGGAWVHLEDSSDMDALAPMFGKGLQIKRLPFPKGRSRFIVRDRNIVAATNSANQRELRWLKSRLKGQNVFQGSSDAYIGGIKEFNRLSQAGRLPKKVYIINGGRFIAVSPEFMNENPSVKAFISGQGSAFFRKPVKNALQSH